LKRQDDPTLIGPGYYNPKPLEKRAYRNLSFNLAPPRFKLGAEDRKENEESKFKSLLQDTS